MRRHRLYGIALSCTPEPGTRSRTGSFPDWPLGPMQLACVNANLHAPMNRSTPSFSYAPRRQWVFLVVPAFGLLLVVALWAAVLLGLAAGERLAVESELRDTASYVASFEQRVRRILGEHDRTLQLLKSETERTGRPDIRRLAEFGLIRGDETGALVIVDRHGVVIASNQSASEAVNLGDRDYFRRHAEFDSGTMDISQPVVGRISGRKSIILSRRLNAANGDFAGVVTVSVSPALFADYYVEASLGGRGVLGVFGLDGVYRARRFGTATQDSSPIADPSLVARALDNAAGSLVTDSRSDGIVRLVAYRRLRDYPLVLIAEQSKDEAISDFNRHRRAYLALAIGGTLAILPFFGVLTLIMHRLRRKTEQLRNQRTFLQELLDNIPVGISVRRLTADGSGTYIVWNETNGVMYGVAKESALGRTVVAIASPATAERVLEWDRQLIASPSILDVVEMERLPNGATSHIHRVRAPIFDAGDEAEYVVTVSENVTSRHEAEEKLRLLSKVFETTADGIVIADAEDKVIAVNTAFTRLSGYTPQEMLGHPLWTSPFAPLDPEASARRMDYLHATGFVTAEVRRTHKDGTALYLWVTASVVRDESGGITNYVRTFTDISQLKSAQRQLEQFANFDLLTGLPNRRLFNDRLELALAGAARKGEGVGLLFLDLDGFKRVNDDHGHEVGDELLRLVAARMAECVRASDSLCRLGGDEFTVISEKPIGTEQVAFVAKRIQNVLSKPFLIGGRQLKIGVSIGIAVYPANGLTANDLLSHADTAMYHAKKSGGNRHAFYRATGSSSI